MSDARSDAKSIAQRNKAAREKRANDPEQLAALMGKVDRDKYDFEGYDDKAIAMAFQGDAFGDEDYARLTGKSMGGDDPKSGPTAPVVTTPGLTNPVVTADPSSVVPITPDPGLGEALKDKYVNAIVKNNIAQNTGDITVGGENTGILNTGVMDGSTNLIGTGTGLMGRSFRDRVF